MAKGTHAAGGTFNDHELSDPHPPDQVRRAVLGGELLSVGTDSLESSQAEQQSSESEKASLQSPAQTTDSPSNPTGTAEDFTAPTTVTSGRKAKASRSGRASTRVIPDEDEFD